LCWERASKSANRKLAEPPNKSAKKETAMESRKGRGEVGIRQAKGEEESRLCLSLKGTGAFLEI